jgi:hypothetical protein
MRQWNSCAVGSEQLGVEDKQTKERTAIRSSALFGAVAVLLERYLERELDLAFRLGRAGKEAEVGIRYSVVGLRRTLERAKSCLIPGVEEVRSKDDTSLLFAEWKHLFQR